jgi:hypothetical protein
VPGLKLHSFRMAPLALAILLLPACKKQTPVVTPQLPAPTLADPGLPKAPEVMPQLPNPPQPEQPPPPQPQVIAPLPEPKVEAAKPASQPQRKKPKRTPPPTKAVDQPAAPPPPVPSRLGQILSPDQEHQYQQAVAESIQRARTNVAAIEKHGLTQQQRAVVAQIRSFIQQAEDIRNSDLVTAKGLSNKADLLASDLARSFE